MESIQASFFVISGFFLIFFVLFFSHSLSNKKLSSLFLEKKLKRFQIGRFPFLSFSRGHLHSKQFFRRNADQEHSRKPQQAASSPILNVSPISYPLKRLIFKDPFCSWQTAPQLESSLSERPIDLDRANAVLDDYKDQFGSSLCFLLNPSGIAIASSDFSEQRFIGTDYSFRPYYQHSMEKRIEIISLWVMSRTHEGIIPVILS